MSKPKAKTRLEAMGFMDPELATQAHDDLVIATQQRMMDEWELNVKSTPVPTINKGEGQPKRQCRKPEFIWEYPVRENWSNGRKGPIVGFIDLVVTLCYYKYSVKQHRDLDGIGWVDSDHKIKEQSQRIFIEVKTKIISLGELLRQLETYKSSLSTHGRPDIALSIPGSKITDTQIEIVENNGYRVILL